MIFCYSGTGNCLASAKQLKEIFNLPIKLITADLTADYYNGDLAIFIFPAYAYGLPVSAKKFIQHNNFNYKYLAVITTYGTHYGGALAESIRLFRRRKQKVNYSVGIKSVENYAPVFGLPDNKKITKVVASQKVNTISIANSIQQRKENRRLLFRPFSKFISILLRVFTPLLTSTYKVLSSCNGCGLCAKLCSARAISIINNKPKFKVKKCDHCQACLQLCPKKAISYVRINSKSKRYRHPDIETSELIKPIEKE